MGWLATLFGGAYYATSGPKKPASAVATPPINASSSDEADFIKCVIYYCGRLCTRTRLTA
jgi:F-type H+-transporting ATPase subunit k